jgi:ABC-type polysaccharide/polyol phosphate transport system ATPase subunit
LTLAGVGKRYRQGELVLNGVELEMERGRVLGIIGTNGSGKSTLLRILPEFSRERAGTVTVRPEVGYLPDRYARGAADERRHTCGTRGASAAWRGCPKWTRC